MQDQSARRLLFGTVWRMVGIVGSQLARLLTGLFLARTLGRNLFGQFGLLQNTIGLLGTVASLSLGNNIVKHVAEFRRTNPSKAGKMIGFGLVTISFSATFAAGVLFILAPIIARRALGNSDLIGLLKLLSLDVALNAIASVQISALIGMEAFRAVASNTNAKSIFNLASTLVGASVDGLRGAVVAQVFTDAVFLVVTAITLRSHCRNHGIIPKYQISLSDWNTLRDFSLPTLLTSALGWFAQWFSNAALGRQVNGYADFAIFQVGRQWANTVTMVPSAMGEAGLPLISNQYGEGQANDFSRTVKSQYRLAFRISIAAAITVIVFSPAILMAYGKDFKGSYGPIIIMSVCGVFQSLTTIANIVIFSTGRLWQGFVFTLGFSALLIGLAFSLRSYGAVGLASAYLAAYLVDVGMLKVFADKILVRLKLQEASTA